MKNITYINAGAGSGKTYNLTRILSEKLSGKDKNGNPIPKVEPSQVILTTFTELAATEAREKARQSLLESNNLDAAAQMDSAAMGTVHSVALSFIKKFWYLLDYGADVQVITDRDEDFYMNQSLAGLINKGDKNIEGHLENFRKFRDFYDICDSNSHPDYLFWQRYLRIIVEKMDYYNVDDVEKSIEKNLETLKKIYVKDPVNYDFVEMALKAYRDFCKENSNKPNDACGRASEASTKLLTKSKDRKWLFEVKELMKSPCKPKTAEKECVHFTKFLKVLNDEELSSSHLQVMEPFIISIFDLAKAWRDDFNAYKKSKHIISYNDMERLFLKLITEEKEAKDYIRNTYRLVMVDEFQDSNPIQLKIFNQLSELIAPEGHSYWVGDPKQAIYGFRGADTDLVNSVTKYFKFYPDAEIHPEEGLNNLGTGRLTESWRSRPKLVNLVNEVFSNKFAGEIDPLCITLEPHFKEDDLHDAALQHWHNPPRDGRQKSVDVEALAWKVKDLIASGRLVHSGRRDEVATPIRPKDVAVLCRKNETAKSIVKALRKYGVPVAESEDAIMQRIEVQLVVTLLQFVQNPSNKHVIADLMRLLWGKTTKKILQNRIAYVLEKDEKGDFVHLDEEGKLCDDQWMMEADQVKSLTKLTERFKHLSVPEMVRAIIYECDLPALTARWGDSHIRQQNLSTVQHLADDYDQMCLQMGLGSSVNGFIFYLNSNEPDKEKDNQSDTVKVFTYHGSKGLEWPVVIMNELDQNTLEQSDFIRKNFMSVREMVLEDKATEDDPFAKTYYLHFFPNIIKGAKGKAPDPMRDIIIKMPVYILMLERAKGEEKRLLYVGMTRAKDYLITTGINDSFTWLTNVGIEFVDKEHIWGLKTYPNDWVHITVPGEGEYTADEQQYSLKQKSTTHTERGKRYLSPSKLESFEGFVNHEAWNEQGTAIDTKGWGDEYDAIGSSIHDIFAACRKGEKEANYEKAINIISGYGTAKQLTGHIDAIFRSAEWLHEQLQQRFPQQAGDKIERELPFVWDMCDGTTLRGDMDLLWHYTDEQGKKHCVLVDYKSFYGSEQILDGQTRSHYAQLSAYAYALKKAGVDVTHVLIYYPVHGVVHELR